MQKLPDRARHRLAQAGQRLAEGGDLGGCQGKGDRGGHQHGRGGKGGGPTQPARQQKPPRADHQAGAAVAQVVGRRPGAPLRLRQQIGAVGVNDNVLACTGQGQHQGRRTDGGQAGRAGAGLQQGHGANHGHQDELKHQNPAAAPVGPGQGPAVQGRRPKHLERVGQFGQGQQADQGQGDGIGGQPALQ